MKRKIKPAQIKSIFYLFVKKIIKLFFLVLSCALLCACIGVSMDLTIRADGSGLMALEYRISRMAETLGKLDGNERWQTVPVGQADFERSMARLPRLKLSSFSSSDKGQDLVTRAEISYKNIEDILAFLDASNTGQSGRALYENKNGKNRLLLILADADLEVNADQLSLAQDIFSGYSLSFSMSVPGTAELALTDGKGNKIDASPESVQLISRGKKVSAKMNTSDLFGFSGGLGMEFTW